VAGVSSRNAGRDAALTYVVVLVGVTVLMKWVHVDLPLLGAVGPAGVALLFLYAPIQVGNWRGEDIDDYGFHAAPVRDGLVLYAVAIAIAFPIFVAVYFGFYEVACGSSTLRALTPPGLCGRYTGLAGVRMPPLDLDLVEFAAMQLIVVAMPEELFFRGFLLGLLEQRFPPSRRWRGGGVGLALVLSSLAFALVHLPRTGDPRQLMTFFPGLLFGWMRSSTRSVLAPTVMHASCNVLIYLLEHAAQR
jgi:uncharacterized protein